jgi:hypothetical protein
MTLPTHFISVLKSYLHCWNHWQHQSWRAVTTRLNMFSGLQFSFLQFNFINCNVSLLKFPEFSSVVEYARPFGEVLPRVRIAKGSLFAGLAFARVTILNIRKSMESVALAGPPSLRVNDNLQTCPTVYKSHGGTPSRGEPELSTSVLLPKSRRFTKPWGGPAFRVIFPFHFARCNGSRKLFSNSQFLVAYRDAF